MKVPPPLETGKPDETPSPSEPSLPDTQTVRQFERLLHVPSEAHRSVRSGGGQKQAGLVPNSGNAWPNGISQPGEGGDTAGISDPSWQETGFREQKSEDEKRRSGAEGAEQARMFSGERILAGMGSAEAMPVHSGNRSGWELGELARRLAERILVARGEGFKSQEIRIRLKDSLFPGTEIVLRKNRGGVEIQFQTNDTEVQRTLHAHLDTLQQALDTHLGERVPVYLSVSVADTGKDLPEDGRSRNRRRFDEEKDSDEP